jgi:hypothetical protein
MIRSTNHGVTGLAAALLAALLQLTLITGVFAGMGEAGQRASAPGLYSHICTYGGTRSDHPAPPANTACLLCPVCVAMALGTTLAPTIPVPAPPGVSIPAPAPLPPPFFAAPAPAIAAAYPRGPPLI